MQIPIAFWSVPMKGKVLAVLSLCAIAAFGSSQAIVNGGFNGSANGWTTQDTAGFGGYQSNDGTGLSGYFLLDGDNGPTTFPTLSQTLTDLTPGVKYHVVGFYQTVGSYQASDPFKVQINGNTLFTGSTTGPVNGWVLFSVDFYAADSEALLTMHSEITGSSSYGVDGLSIAEAVPEPASCVALAIGVLGALKLRRTRKRNTIDPDA
jgi:hypothetical protein